MNTRTMTFRERVALHDHAGLRTCAGLDPVTERMPSFLRARHGDDVPALWKAFMGALIEATAGHVAAYKPNWAFFLTLGVDGVAVLVELCRLIRARAPEALLIIDMKVGDIADTNMGYTSFAYDRLDADAVTVHPYLGREALGPFLRDATRGAYVLCRTSNVGAGEFQDLVMSDGSALHMAVATHVARWNTHSNCGLVVGATAPSELRRVRAATPELPLLIPGVGKQGGSVREVVDALGVGGAGYVINQSSAFMYASDGACFAEDAAAVLATMQRDVQASREVAK
jgi:orotidine-5'-phosphate decarboxylase